MNTLTIEPELYNRIQKAAQDNRSDIGEFVKQAIQQYIWELGRQKISDESKIYRQRHTELKKKFLGRYIAMHEGRVVDDDAEFSALRQRIRQKFGETPVMITLVEDVAEQALVRHGFRME